MSDFDQPKNITPADLPDATPVPEFNSEAEQLQYWFGLTGAGVKGNHFASTRTWFKSMIDLVKYHEDANETVPISEFILGTLGLLSDLETRIEALEANVGIAPDSTGDTPPTKN